LACYREYRAANTYELDEATRQESVNPLATLQADTESAMEGRSYQARLKTQQGGMRAVSYRKTIDKTDMQQQRY